MAQLTFSEKIMKANLQNQLRYGVNWVNSHERVVPHPQDMRLYFHVNSHERVVPHPGI